MTTPFQITQSFVPTQIPGCQLWFDAADNTTFSYSSSNIISEWRDKSSNAYSVIQPTVAKQPTLTSSAQNNLPGIQFGSNLFLYQAATSMPNFTTGGSTSVLMAARNANNNDSWNIINTIWFDINGLTATQRYHLSFNQNATDGTTLYTNGALVGQVTSNAVGASANALLGFTVSATSQTIHTNGSTDSYAGTTLPDATGNTDFIFNDARNNAASANTMIFEMVGYNTQITTAQRQQLEGYLAWKWGMVANLPANHPYKTTSILSLPPFPSAPRVKNFTNVTTYNPTSISNCILWLDGADISQMFTDTAGTTPVTSSGQSVKCWKDKSTQANHATNNTSPPTVTFNAQNNYSVVDFSSQYLSVDVTKLPTGSTPFTFFILLKLTSPGVQVYMSWGTAANNKAPQFYFANYQPTIDFYGSDRAIASSASFNNTYVVISVNASSSVNGWTNGTIFSNQTNNAPLTLDTGTTFAYIGVGQVSNNLTYYLAGQIAEIIGYNRVLTTQERQQVEGYLQWKWGLSSTIPSGNPYNVTPPYSTNPFPLVPRIPYTTNKYFLPTSITGSYLWLDASIPNNFTFSSGSNISTWIDRSGNSYTATAGNNPTYDSVNKRVRFVNTSSQYMSNTAAPLNLAQRSFFFVVEDVTYISVGGYMPIIPNPTSGTDYQTTTGLTIENNTGFKFYGNSGGYDNRIAGAAAANAKGIYSEVFGSLSGTTYKNGTAGGTSNANYTPGTSKGYALGGRWSNGIAAPYIDSYYYEVIVYNNAVSTTQRQQVEGYLAWKWGLQGSLPANHPFKLFPPAP